MTTCRALLWILAMSVVSSASALACQCVQRPDVEAEFARSAAVFLGTATSDVRVANGIGTSSFSVEVVFKGDVPPATVVRTGGRGSCGIRFASGTRYLVYARRETDGGWFTNICTRTVELAGGWEDIAWIEAMRKTHPNGAAR